MTFLDFQKEFGAVRSMTVGEAANKKAFDLLIKQLRTHTTRDKIRKVWFGPSNGLPYRLNSTIKLTDLEDVIFEFDSGPEFSGSPGFGAGIYFMWTGAQTGAMFSIISSGSTIQRGLHWRGSWTFCTSRPNYGTALFIDGVNNWGGPSSVLSFTTQGQTKSLRRGLVLDNKLNGDNAHGVIGAMYSGGVQQGALIAMGGGCAIQAGNISTEAGQIGVFVGPNGSEVKLMHPLKIDGGGTVGIDCRGSDCNFYGQMEGFANADMVLIRRTAEGNSGRYNTLGCNFNGRGTSRAWRVFDELGDGQMWGNKLAYPSYTNTKDQSTKADPEVLPVVGVFEQGQDGYRVIQGSRYV